jgi:hypothetical protein
VPSLGLHSPPTWRGIIPTLVVFSSGPTLVMLPAFRPIIILPISRDTRNTQSRLTLNVSRYCVLRRDGRPIPAHLIRTFTRPQNGIEDYLIIK